MGSSDQVFTLSQGEIRGPAPASAEIIDFPANV